MCYIFKKKTKNLLLLKFETQNEIWFGNLKKESASIFSLTYNSNFLPPFSRKRCIVDASFMEQNYWRKKLKKQKSKQFLVIVCSGLVLAIMLYFVETFQGKNEFHLKSKQVYRYAGYFTKSVQQKQILSFT